MYSELVLIYHNYFRNTVYSFLIFSSLLFFGGVKILSSLIPEISKWALLFQVQSSCLGYHNKNKIIVMFVHFFFLCFILCLLFISPKGGTYQNWIIHDKFLILQFDECYKLTANSQERKVNYGSTGYIYIYTTKKKIIIITRLCAIWTTLTNTTKQLKLLCEKKVAPFAINSMEALFSSLVPTCIHYKGYEFTYNFMDMWVLFF